MTTPDPSEPLDRHGELVALVMKLSGDVAELSSRVGEQEADNAELRGLLDEIETQSPDATPDESPTLDLRGLVAWVRENVTLVLERKIPQNSASNWCRSWWLHPEALVRFNAARESWLGACVSDDGNAKAVSLEHLDHQLGVLMAPDGPFSSCAVDKHRDGSLDQRLLGQVEPDESYYLDFERAHDQLAQTQPLPQTAAHGGHR